MKIGNVELSYVEGDGNGGWRNATRSFPASMGVMTAFNRVGHLDRRRLQPNYRPSAQ